MAVSANYKKPKREYEAGSVQEGSKRRNSRVSVVSGTITETYPLRYPRFYFSFLFLPRVRDWWCSRLLSQISVARRYANIAGIAHCKKFSH